MPGQQGLHIANPDMDDWGHQPSPTTAEALFPGFPFIPSDTPTVPQSTTLLPTRQQPDKPLPPTPLRRRDIFKRRAKKTGTVVGVVLAVPLLPAIVVVGGIGLVVAGGAECVHACFAKRGKNNRTDEVDEAEKGFFTGSRGVPPPTPTLPHHNYGCNVKYERYVETIQEHSILVSAGKMDPSEAILG